MSGLPEKVESERLHGRARPWWRGFMLTIVTLGIYPLWWHYATHREVHRQLGRENRDMRVWGSYVLIIVFITVLGVLLVPGPDFVTLAEEMALMEARWAGLGMFYVALNAVAVALFAVYAYRQFRLLDDAFSLMGRPASQGKGSFVAVAVAIFVLTWFFLPALFVGLVVLPVIYAALQKEYNRFWNGVWEIRTEAVAAPGYSDSDVSGPSSDLSPSASASSNRSGDQLDM